ncbi:hypothetical protein [Actinoplanes sp. NPDC049802]|uniref:nSTAND1 domain-containing NTPase n=1 Tax=Actinoplanes sp. NPDC049802 TaxID=3154742 RepID=UPI0033D40D64
MTPVPPMPDNAARLLVTVVEAVAPSDDSGDGDAVGALFTTSLGFRQGPILTLGNTLGEQLRDLAGECTGSDTLVVTIAARASVVEDDLLLLPDPPGERAGVRLGRIVASLLADTPVRRLALLLDVRGDPEDAARAVRARLRAGPAGVAADAVLEVVLAVTPAVAVHTGDDAGASAPAPSPFAVRFARAAMSPASGGPTQPVLTLAGIVRTLRAGLSHEIASGAPVPTGAPDGPAVDTRAADLAVTHHHAGPAGGTGVTLPNPRHTPTAAASTRFIGRRAALAAVTGWLAAGRDAPVLLVVAGAVGSGKSALLRAAAGTDHAIGGAAAGPGLRLDAKGRTVDDVVARITAAPKAGPTGAGAPHHSYHGRADAGRPLTVVVDGVDEAVDPPELIRAVSALLAAADGGLRALLAVRHELLPLFGAEARIVDLDAEEYIDRDAVRELAGEELRRALPDGLFATADATLRARAAEAIAAGPEPSFLTARIVAASVAANASLASLADPQWHAALPHDLDAAVDAELSGRLGSEAARAKALLLPLAYAQGNGLPWEDTWPALAEALHPGERYGHDDLRWLCDTVPGYVVEDLSDGQSVYRLSHAALAGCLRAGRDETADHHAIAGALRAAVPRTAGQGPGWADAQAYTRTHLITHAAAGQDADDLFTDVGFLLAAAHPQVVAALPAARSEAARAAVDAYRRAEEHLGVGTEGTHAAYLELAARCGGATALADAVAEVPRPWSARWSSWHVDLPHRPLAGHTGAVLCAAVGRRAGADVAVTGADDHTLRLWDLASGEPMDGPLRGHTASVTAVVTGRAGDRTVAVSGSDDRTIRVWDLDTGSPAGEPLTGHTGGVTALGLGTVGGRTWLVSAGRDGTVRRWDPCTGRPVGPPLTGHTGAVTAVALGELDGSPIVVSGGHDTTIRVWDLTDGAPLGKPISGHDAPLSAIVVAVHDEVPTAVSADRDGIVRRWNVSSHSPIGLPLTGHTEAVTDLALAELDGTPVVLSSSDDRTVRVWALATGRTLGEPLAGHTRGVAAVAFGHVNGWPVVVSGGHDHTVRLWDSALPGHGGRPFAGHSDAVMSLAAQSLDGTPVVVSGSADHTVRVWDLLTGHPIGRPLTGHTGAVWSIANGTRDGRPVVVSGGADHRLRLWDLAEHRPLGEPLTGHGAWVWAVALTEIDGQPVAVSGADDHTVRVWDLNAMTQLHHGVGHSGGVTALAVGRLDDRPIAVSGGRDKRLRLWNLENGRLVDQPMSGHSGTIWAVALGEVDGRQIAFSGAADSTVRLWDLVTCEPLGKPLTGHYDTVTALALARIDDRPVLVSGSEDRTVRVWDVATRKIVGKPLTGHSGGVRAVAVVEREGAPVVVAGGHDNSIRVWDLATGTPLEYATAERDAVGAVAIGDLNGVAVVVSGGADRCVRMWSLSTGQPVGAVLTGHTGPVTALAMTEIDRRSVAVSAGPDRTVRLWDLAAGRALGDPLAGHPGGAACVAVGHVDREPVVVTGGDDHAVRLWDPATGLPRGGPLTEHTGAITCVAVGRLDETDIVVSGGADRTVRLWSLATGRPLGEPLTGHTAAVTAVAICQVGEHPMAVTADAAGGVRAWNLAVARHRRWSLRRERPVAHPGEVRVGTAVSGLAHLGAGRLALAAGSALLIGGVGTEPERRIVLDTPILAVAGRGGHVVAGTERGVIALQVTPQRSAS